MSYLECEITSDNSTKAASTAFVKSQDYVTNSGLQSSLTNYLSLSGGTMLECIRFTHGDAIYPDKDDGYIAIFGGSEYRRGAYLKLYGKDTTNANGRFVLIADDGDHVQILDGHPDGTLVWGGVSVLNPVGTVIAFAANSDPNGYLLCNGGAVSRTTYARLFSVIGTLYGEGDGSTTFNLPNLTDRFIQGSGTAGTVNGAGLPNIEGRPAVERSNNSSILSGSFYIDENDKGLTHALTSTVTGYINLKFSASRSNSIYGNSTTVQPPALTMRYYIKY